MVKSFFRRLLSLFACVSALRKEPAPPTSASEAEVEVRSTSETEEDITGINSCSTSFTHDERLDKAAAPSTSWTYMYDYQEVCEEEPRPMQPAKTVLNCSPSSGTEADLQSTKSSGEATPSSHVPMLSRSFEHPLHQGKKFELQAGADVLGLVLPTSHRKAVSVCFSVDGWETAQVADGELEPGGDRVYFRIPVGRDAIRQVTGVGEGRGGIDLYVRYTTELAREENPPATLTPAP